MNQISVISLSFQHAVRAFQNSLENDTDVLFRLSLSDGLRVLMAFFPQQCAENFQNLGS